MLVNTNENRRNLRTCWTLAIVGVLIVALFAWLSPWILILVPVPPLVAYWLRYRTARRYRVLQNPFPKDREAILNSHVSYYRALDLAGKKRFRDLMTVFLDEVRITGIRTDVDETTRTLVAASAVIPIFAFEDWEYSTLGEVLIYPGSFDGEYQTDEATGANILGMVGTNHLSGVMILSKPSLLAGFANDSDKRNVGIHEFAHLVDKQDGDIDGTPPGVSADIYAPWVKWVGEELKRKAGNDEHIDDYAYTNEAEYFAVLSEYFFESPAILEKKDPRLYDLMRKMYRQNTKRLFAGRPKRRKRVGRNDPCPCGSGEKFKRCCRRNR
ncbi:hypothetical protein Q31b_02160 [Novipirellula aureliae]|uniref:Protein MtfA n=1 Tax=Novipirellula aureliae TaxID=2527966 RepID=A0A5C6E961_9BACT|nr:M90 family metallopeptidase [Novipirellula aureliae]TWU45045.1 hypothetical protein Q31b_02160 [Novipirellula aureliae]